MVAQYEKVTADKPRGSSFFCREFTAPVFTAPWHFHPECELTLILESRGRRFVGDSVEPFDAGDLVLLGPNLPHCWINSPAGSSARRGRPGARAVVAQFSDGLMLQDDGAELAAVRALLTRRAPRGVHFSGGRAGRLSERLRRLPDGRGLARLLELLVILDELAHLPPRAARLLTSEGYVPRLDAEQAGRLERVCRMVSAGYAEKISQPQAASLAGLSPAAFSRFFRRKMGKTFVDYLHGVRVGEACRLLIEQDDLSIAEICYACGFGNLSNFNHHFRRLQGVGPRDFRRRHLTAARRATGAD